MKSGQTVESLSFPYDVNIFKEDVQLVLSLLSQILGLDNDKFAIEVMSEIIMKVNMLDSSQIVFLNFNESLAKVIHDQLVNFHALKHFHY